jgi:hypothetical protein
MSKITTSSVAAGDVVDVPLLKLESSGMMMMGKGITTMQFYKGDSQEAVQFLKERLQLVAEQNPWICATIVKGTGGLKALRYPKAVSIDQIFAQDDTLVLTQEIPYQELVQRVGKSSAHVPSGSTIMKTKCPVTKCTVAKTGSSDGFVVLFSISHVIADGFTYYAILDMIFEGAEIFPMDPVRNEAYREKLPDVIGKKDEKWMTKPGCGQICNFLGIMCCGRKNMPVYCYTVDPEKLKAEKEKAKTAPGAPEFVSTNDILTSGFGRATQTRLLTMAMDFRGRIDGLTKQTAGCYHAGLLFGPECYESAGSIRKALTGPAPLSRAGKLPGCCGATKGNWTAMISNWSSASKGNYSIPNCEHLLHIPYVQTKDMPVDFCIVFKARKDEVAVMLGLQYGQFADLKAELPIDKPISANMFVEGPPS